MKMKEQSGYVYTGFEPIYVSRLLEMRFQRLSKGVEGQSRST